MNVYRFEFHVEEDIEAGSPFDAWEIAKKRLLAGFYGPTLDAIGFIQEISEAEE